MAKMKQLKSSLTNIRHIIEHTFAARDIAELLVSFDDTQDAEQILSFMKRVDYDVVGVKKDGHVAGYAHRDKLKNGNLADHIVMFESSDVVHELSGLADVFPRLVEPSSRVFVSRANSVWGIITRGDLQKAPVRMYLFALVSLIEMQTLRVIQEYLPDEETWCAKLPPGRVGKAQKGLKNRRQRNEGVSLAECLEFSDKITIVENTPEIWSRLGFESRDKAGDTFKELKHLRNDLAHGQDILAGRWPGLFELAREAENLLGKCEAVRNTPQKLAQ